MTLEQNFKSKGQASYCMYLRVKKSILQGDISEMEKNISPLRSKQGASNYTYTYTESEKQLLNSTNLKLTGLYKELDVYSQKIKENNCQSYYDSVNTCKSIDEQIKSKTDLVAQFSKEVLEGKKNPITLKQLNLELLNQKNNFTKYNCKNLIEYERLAELGLLVTEKSAEQEKNILTKGYNEQYVYIGVGAVVLLAGLYVYMKK